MFMKLFRHTGYESILEGEIVQTGVGFVARRRVYKLQDLFKLTGRKQKTPAAKAAPEKERE
jgi:hypothetical protein